MVYGPWWLRIMGIGASTHVKEIRIDQKDTKWQSCPASASSRRGGKNRNLSSLSRWINHAEETASRRRLQQLNNALDAAEKRAQDGEQRVRQLERELANLELRNMELAEEASWLRKQLSDRPEVPIAQRPPTGTKKFGSNASIPNGSDSTDAYRIKQNQYVAKLESQIKLYEEDILKMKTKMNKETQRLQAELEDQKHRAEKEVRSLDNHLIEAHKLNQKYEEAISAKISTDAVAQLRKEALTDYNSSCASTIAAAASSCTSINFGLDNLSQSKSRAQLILELTEQISLQQDKIRELEDEIVQRDIELARVKAAVHGDDPPAFSSSMRKSSLTGTGSISGQCSNAAGAGWRERRGSPGSARKTYLREEAVTMTTGEGNAISIVANEDEIEALLNNPTMMYESDEDDEENDDGRKPENDGKKEMILNSSASQDHHQQRSWRKDTSAGASSSTSACVTAASLPPSGANSKRINIMNEGNKASGKISLQSHRPKTMASNRPRLSASPKRQSTVDELVSENIDEPGRATKAVRQASVDSASPQGSRTHSAPMFAFKPRPSSKQSLRSVLSSAICGGELPPPIDLEDPASATDQEPAEEEKRATPRRKNQSMRSERMNSESMEVLSLHGQDTNDTALSRAPSELVTSGYDSAAVAYDDEGDVEDEEEENNCPDDDNSDQEIRRRFEERWRKSTTAKNTTKQRPRIPRPPAGGGVGQASNPSSDRERLSTSAKSHDSGFLGDSCASTNSLSLWKGRNRRNTALQQTPYDPLDVDKLLEM